MPIYVMHPSGRLFETAYAVGSKKEKEYYRVMTDRWGKLFFVSRKDYVRWSRTGRLVNNRDGTLKLHKDHPTTDDIAIDYTLDENPNSDDVTLELLHPVDDDAVSENEE